MSASRELQVLEPGPLARLAPTTGPEPGGGEVLLQLVAEALATQLSTAISAQASSLSATISTRLETVGARPVLSVAEAAEVLGISRALAYDLVRRGELPSVHLGRRIVVPRLALERLLHGPR